MTRLLLLILFTFLFTAPAFAQDPSAPPPVTVRAISKKIVHPGEQLAVAIIIQHADGFHTYPSTDQDVLPPNIATIVAANRTTIDVVKRPDWIRKDGMQWPEPHDAASADPSGEKPTIQLKLYTGTAKAYLRLIIAENAQPGDRTLEIKVHYQACNDTTCFREEDVTLSIPLTIVAAGVPSPDPSAEELLALEGFDAKFWGAAPPTRSITFTFFGLFFKLDPSGPLGLTLLMLLAALGGLLLNFTPCVLPVIPIKIMSLSQHAGNPGRCFYLGTVMSLGVIAFWLAIGSAMAFISSFKTISTLFSIPWVPLGIGLFMLIMGLGMFGLFTIRLPQAVYSVNPKGDTTVGSFLFGGLTALLSTPCTAPFMGAAAAWATSQPPAITMATFTAIGVGMALPYFILCARPKLLSKMPRTGPASELVKQVMGLCILAVAIFFIGLPIAGWLRTPPDPASRLYWWLVGALLAAAGLWLAWRTINITRRPLRRAYFVTAGLLMTAIGIMGGRSLGSHGPIKWVYYTPERFAQARAEGKIVVVDFTAEWCLNCKALEAGVLHHPSVVKVLNEDPAVVPIKVDITFPDGEAFLKSLNWIGIPYLVTFGPGVREPVKYDSYTIAQVLETIEKARGTPMPAGVPAAQR